jgi:hypothetical protein
MLSAAPWCLRWGFIGEGEIMACFPRLLLAAILLTAAATSASARPISTPLLAPAAQATVQPGTPAASTEDEFQSRMIIAEWMLSGVLIAAIIGIITLRRRRNELGSSAVDFPELKPAPVPATRP